MDLLTGSKFTFISRGLPADTFAVVDFSGIEGLSRCYEFEINLASVKPDLDLTQLLKYPATFTIYREEGEIPFHGIIVRFEQRQAFNKYVFYRAVLVPRFWWLTLTRHNQVFLDQTVPEILDTVLKDGGLASEDFEMRLSGEYSPWEYVCQFQESHFHFLSRWMEREGIYYYFEQNEDREKLILTDSSLAHTGMPQGEKMIYAPPSGLDAGYQEEVVKDLICRRRLLPESIMLKDYNYLKPSLDVTGQAPVSSGHGRGQVYLYGEYFLTPEEGDRLARIRAQGYLCREQEFLGESRIPFLRPGYVFSLQRHYREDFNRKYLTVELQHQGNQTAYLISGLKEALSQVEEAPRYNNSFTLIPAEVQFRPEDKTPKPRFNGALSAKIDAEGSGEYAELDDSGRYKVVLPFDLSGRQDGHASAWLRMMQPYAGSNHGMHFPLHKGAEVMLAFEAGDPDRPFIAGAIPNPEHPSPVTNDNQTKSVIRTGGQNRIEMEDQEGNQRILLHSPTSNTWVRLGAPNDPDSTWDKDSWKFGGFKDTGYALSTEGALDVKVFGVKNELIMGSEVGSIKLGDWELNLLAGILTEFILGGTLEIHWPKKWHYAYTSLSSRVTNLESTVQHVETAESNIEIIDNQTSLLNDSESIVNNQNTVTLTKTEIAEEVNSIISEQIQAVNEQINTISEQLNAVNQSIESHTTKISNIATGVKSIGTQLKTVNTSVEEKETTVEDLQTSIRQVGVNIEQSELFIIN